MQVEPSAVLRHLRTVVEPIDMRELSTAMSCAEYPEQLRNVVTMLVRTRQVTRHHNGDGILRYSIAGAVSASQEASARQKVDAAQPAPTMALANAAHSEPSKEMQLYAHIGNELLTSPELVERTGLPMSTVANLLQRLKAKGLVRKHGGYRNAKWTRVVPSTAPTSEAAPDRASQSSDQEQPIAIDALRNALTANAKAAEAALDTYIRSVTDPAIYSQLKHSAQASKDALAVLEGRAAA